MKYLKLKPMLVSNYLHMDIKRGHKMNMTDELDEIMGWTTTSYEGEKVWELVDGRMSGTDYKLALLRLQGDTHGK